MKRRGRFPFNQKGESNFWESVVNVFTLGMGGDMFGFNKPIGPAAGTPPDPNAATQAALDAQNKSRKSLLASGGATGQGQSSPILGSDIHSLNLGG